MNQSSSYSVKSRKSRRQCPRSYFGAVQRVRETLQNERDHIKCAIKLLPEFFTTDEMAASNTEGNYGKQPLDKTKLRTLKGD